MVSVIGLQADGSWVGSWREYLDAQRMTRHKTTSVDHAAPPAPSGSRCHWQSALTRRGWTRTIDCWRALANVLSACDPETPTWM